MSEDLEATLHVGFLMRDRQRYFEDASVELAWTFIKEKNGGITCD